ncbi:MAG: YceD family protein [Pseudomonadota bacterium]
MFARPFIDSLDFALMGKTMHGEIPVRELVRLHDVLADTEGAVRYVLRGFQDKQGEAHLELSLEGDCNLRCQRCLRGLGYSIRQTSRLRLSQDPDWEASPLEEEEEDSIPADKHMDVLALVEDEILLALPFASKHEEGSCRMASEHLVQPDANPFAVLAGLKKN